MATILDVATRAGVGVGTVSRVLNDSRHVSDLTRARVQAVIDELGYRPSSVARALSSGRTSAIVVLAARATLPSAVARLEGILSVFDDANEIVICNVAQPDQRSELVARHTDRQPAGGALAISLDLGPDEVAAFERAAVSIVSIDFEVPGVPSLVVDDVAAGTAATRHLLDLGHRRIAFLGDPETGDYRSRASTQRRQGYLAAMAESGLESSPGHEVHVGEAGKKAAAAALMTLPEPPTAVFASSDAAALCVLGEARTQGISVPNDLSVIGFDDVWAASAAGLTTMRQPLFESGKLAARMLQAARRGETVASRVDLEVDIVVRSTTAPPSA
jgi:LacI family transcriptional regulator